MSNFTSILVVLTNDTEEWVNIPQVVYDNIHKKQLLNYVQENHNEKVISLVEEQEVLYGQYDWMGYVP